MWAKLAGKSVNTAQQHLKHIFLLASEWSKDLDSSKFLDSNIATSNAAKVKIAVRWLHQITPAPAPYFAVAIKNYQKMFHVAVWRSRLLFRSTIIRLRNKSCKSWRLARFSGVMTYAMQRNGRFSVFLLPLKIFWWRHGTWGDPVLPWGETVSSIVVLFIKESESKRCQTRN